MLDSVTNGNAESEEEDLRNSKEGNAKDNIANGPAIFQCAEDKD